MSPQPPSSFCTRESHSAARRANLGIAVAAGVVGDVPAHHGQGAGGRRRGQRRTAQPADPMAGRLPLGEQLATDRLIGGKQLVWIDHRALHKTGQGGIIKAAQGTMALYGTVPIFVRRKWDCPLRVAPGFFAVENAPHSYERAGAVRGGQSHFRGDIASSAGRGPSRREIGTVPCECLGSRRSMLLQLAYRLATEISPRLAMKAGRLWVWKGMRRRGGHTGGGWPAASCFRPFSSSP